MIERALRRRWYVIEIGFRIIDVNGGLSLVERVYYSRMISVSFNYLMIR